MRPTDWPWAVLLCRYSDVLAETRSPDYYADLFTRNGTGGVVDYWREVTLGALDLSGSRVFGWMPMAQSTADIGGLVFPGGRAVLARWGRDAAAVAGVDLRPFRSVLIVQNAGPDHGAAGGDVVIVHTDPTVCEFGFICHEMGHGLGLPHSWAANPDAEYGDGLDVMSFARTTFQFPVYFRGASGHATVGLNARNLRQLGLEASRRGALRGPDFSDQFQLEPLNQPPIGQSGPLVIELPPDITRPARPDGSTWSVELHVCRGWDQGIPHDVVAIHQLRGDGRSYVHQWLRSGEQFTLPDPAVHIHIMAMESSPASAIVRLWDAPDRSLRKEDSKPRVYLIEAGRKRWITSPAALAALGGWSKVKTVPDGGLDSIVDGPDIRLPATSVTPYPVPTGRAVQVTFSATDMDGGAAVTGRVFVDGDDVGATNAAFTHTFRVRRVRIPGTSPPEFDRVYPTVTVRTPGYIDALVDCGFPEN